MPEVFHVDATRPDPGALSEAAAVLRDGGLVAFPTETVYGLGAHALDVAAVKRIFAAKGRPANNPLIVHVADTDAARQLVRTWPEIAQRLADRFWPGPLTLVLPKNEQVPGIVTAGGPTVAVRVPSHPVALALLEKCRLPLAAPSANRSSALSPTRGDHVLQSLDNRFDLLLDAGATPGGLESTVLDLTSTPPRLLRPGLVSVKAIEAALGYLIAQDSLTAQGDRPLASPGLLRRHYAPHTPLEIGVGTGLDRVAEYRRLGLRVGWLTLGPPDAVPPDVVHEALPTDPIAFAARLYAALHELDAEHLDHIVVAELPATDAWLAIRDRLRRATA